METICRKKRLGGVGIHIRDYLNQQIKNFTTSNKIQTIITGKKLLRKAVVYSFGFASFHYILKSFKKKIRKFCGLVNQIKKILHKKRLIPVYRAFLQPIIQNGVLI